MTPLFVRMTERYVPPMNERLMNGLATYVLDDLEEYLDAQIRSICQGMPQNVRYIDYRRCNPQETYEEITRSRSKKRSWNIAESSIFMVNYYFQFTDQAGSVFDITRPLYLIFTDPNEAGSFMMSGSRHHIIPIISDKVITPEINSVFYKLTQDRNKVFREYHSFRLNGKRETRHVAWADICRNTKLRMDQRITKANTVLAHYLFAKYGFSQTFARYTGSVPVICHLSQATEAVYPPDQWKVYTSIRRQPDGSIDRVYKPSDIAIAVPLDKWNLNMEMLIVGMLYVIDHFPYRFTPPERFQETIDEEGEVRRSVVPLDPQAYAKEVVSRLEDEALWTILIGDIRFGNQHGDSKKYTDIKDYLGSLDSYLDDASKRRLAERGIILENYYDFLNYLLLEIDNLLLEGKTSGLSVYGKSLEILSFLTYDITYALTTQKFELNKVASRRHLTKKDVEEALRKGMPTGAIYHATKNKIFSKAVAYSGDHKYPAITSVLAEQESRQGAGRTKSETVVVGPQHYLDLSMVTFGSVLNLPKKTPTPLARVNPWATVDPKTGTILENPKFKELLDENAPLFKF